MTRRRLALAVATILAALAGCCLFLSWGGASWLALLFVGMTVTAGIAWERRLGGFGLLGGPGGLVGGATGGLAGSAAAIAGLVVMYPLAWWQLGPLLVIPVFGGAVAGALAGTTSWAVLGLVERLLKPARWAAIQGAAGTLVLVVTCAWGTVVACGAIVVTGECLSLDVRPHRRPIASLGENVESCCFMPDSRGLVVGGRGGMVSIWDTATGERGKEMWVHDDAVKAVACSPKGDLVASCSGRAIRLWDARTGQGRGMLEGPDKPVGCMVFSPDGARLAAGAGDYTGPGYVAIWNLGTSRLDGLVPKGYDIACLAYSPDRRHLAVASRGERDVTILDGTTGRQVAVLEGEKRPVTFVAYSSREAVLITASGVGGEGSLIRVWNTESWRKQDEFQCPDWGEGVMSLASGGTLLAGDRAGDNAVWVWSVRTRERVGLLKGLRFPVRTITVSPDGERLAAIDISGALAVWEIGGLTP